MYELSPHLSTLVMALAFTSLLPFEAFGSRMAGRSALAVVLTIVAGPGEGSFVLRIALGLILALPTAALLEAASGCVEAIDTMRGQNMAQVYDPTARVENSSLAFVVRLGLWWKLLDSGLLLEYCRAFSAMGRSTAHGSVMRLATESASLALSLFAHAVTSLWPFALAFVALELAGAVVSRLAAIGPPIPELITMKAALVFLTASFFDRARAFDAGALVRVLSQ